jgi:glucosamine--fructose-6-phosphate aminotransferase (isomerizing)
MAEIISGHESEKKMTILAQEIDQQPDVIARLLADPAIREAAAAMRGARHVMLVARGSSDNAARYAQYAFGIHAGLSVALAAPSITTLYGRTPNLRDSVVIGISQSGRSTDVGEVVARAAEQGALTLTLTNDPASPMAKAASHHICLNAGPELSLAASKTYTAQLAVLALLAAHLAGARESQTMLDEAAHLPDLIHQTLKIAPAVAARAERFRFMNRCVVIGRGYNYATAFEIALKLKELTYVSAEPYSSADFRHGPKAMIEQNFPSIVVAPTGAVYPDILAMVQELSDRGADLTVIASEQAALDCAQLPLRLPISIPEWLSPIVAAIPGQLLALHTALAKGHEVDAPRGLSKVTETY